ncbi:CU044_5270 family protein [Micromonospora sp. NBC_01813]|uniref:CU044_5270 family protein n=1 Tax=Micromonospora sp. NBC_01813 TaxID=2975988 RepID=UPI002DD9AA56|nr:CU044_5270 family protein [Micromonospora sp. NBC_01813]WSA07365.1 CU044_5270 family protein [Micromonospora sp. NBC_01813]
MRDQRSLIELMQLADPARDLDVATPPASPLACTRTAPVPALDAEVSRRRAGRRTLVGSLTALTLVAVGVLVLLDPLRQPDRAVAATPPLLAFEYEENPLSARPYLLDLAERLTDDGPEPAGPVTYVHTEAWSLDISAAGGETTSVVIPWKQEIWHAPDGSALRKVTRPSAGPGATLAESIRYAPGEWITPTPSPPSADLAQLRAQVYANQPQENGIKSAVRGVADLYQGWVIPTSVRAQLLRFLAEHEDLKYRGHVTDRAGRTGIAITADSAGAQDIIILDEATGQLLAYESVIVSGAQALAELPAVFSYVLLLKADQVAAIPSR